MKIITIATQKGGAGKTTLATNLSVASANANFTTLLVDADPRQRTALDWFNTREQQENPIVLDAEDHASLDRIINLARQKGIDRVFVDTQGAESNLANQAISVANIVLVPCSSSGFDLSAQRSTGATIQRLKKDASIILTKCPPTGRQEVEEAKTVLSGLGIHINENKTVYRKDYRESAKYSSSVIEDNPEGKAAAEVKKIFSWLESRLNNKVLLNELKEGVLDDVI